MRLLPRRSAGRLVALVILVMLVAQGITFWILADERQGALRSAELNYLLQRIVSAHELIEVVPAQERELALAALSDPVLTLSVDDQAQLAGDDAPVFTRWLVEEGPLAGYPEAFRVRTRILVDDDRCEERDRSHAHDRDDDDDDDAEEYREDWHKRLRKQDCPPLLMVSLPLSGGGWLNAMAQPPAPSWLWLRAAVLGAGITAVLLIVAVLLAVHYLLAPVQRLRLAARDFSRGQPRLLPEKGPEDIRDVIRAFNEMQTTVGKAQEEKARMLAALAHDLRTPLTAMRLRVELLPPGEDRERLLRNLAEMQSLAESTLEFIRGTAAEPPRRFDVGALLESLCEDLADMGLVVHCEELPRSVLEGHPEALRRAVRNLIENAVSYGGQARVSLTRTASSVVIHVTDPGPGIAPELRERVFEPFFRVEASRSRNSGGAGLGLAIARSLVSAMGGQLRITDGPGGKGCEVQVSLPVPSAG